MKKLSYYNIHVPMENEAILLYNSISGSYVLLKNYIYNELLQNDKDVSQFESNHKSTHDQLSQMGFIIDADIDEYESIKNAKIERRLSGRLYNVIINPTMDCNLKCWYCYEGHVEKSEISDELIISFINHLHRKHYFDPFDQLSLNFFGGEPLLKYDKVEKIIKYSDKFCKEKGIAIGISFTTNGTCFTKKMLDLFKDFHVEFQITLDGNKEKHDSVRNYKNSGKGSYETILKNLHKISEVLTDYVIRIRINFDSNTWDEIDSVLDDLDFMDRLKFYIGLHRVWQVGKDEIDHNKVLTFIEEANKRRFRIEYHSLYGFKPDICYADNYNHITLNYNGDIYKCTARDFTEENREGVLKPDGSILWDSQKVLARIAAPIPTVCSTCKILPSCKGVCSQHIMENGWDIANCIFEDDMTIEERVLLSFQQYVLNSEQRQ